MAGLVFAASGRTGLTGFGAGEDCDASGAFGLGTGGAGLSEAACAKSAADFSFSLPGAVGGAPARAPPPALTPALAVAAMTPVLPFADGPL